MKTTSAQANRFFTPIILFITLVLALGVATRVMAGDGSIAAQYSTWAGGKANAEALVHGLRNGSNITISTVRRDGTTSLAGFTPRTAMSQGEVANALQRARASLARLGIERPSAEQIQAALIGGEVETRNGASTIVSGAVGVAGATPTNSRVAATR